MKKSKIVALTFIAYLTLFVLLGILPRGGKLSILAFLILLGYSVFNIIALLVLVYKFIKNKISGKKDNLAIISNNTIKQQQAGNEAISLIDNKESIKNENKTTLAKKIAKTGLGCLLGCLLAPLVLFIVQGGYLTLMALVSDVYDATPSSWKSCTGVTMFFDPIINSSSSFGKKGGVIYYKKGGVNEMLPGSCKILKNSDFASFKPLGTEMAKDINNVYISGEHGIVKIMNGVDVASFEYLDSSYKKDINNVYDYNNNILVGADAATFEVIKDLHGWLIYAKDKNNIYRSGDVVPVVNVDASSDIVELKKYDLNEFSADKVLVYSTDRSGGSSGWDQNGVFLLETGGDKKDGATSTSIFADIKIPEDAEIMKFRFNFKNTNDSKSVFALKSTIEREDVLKITSDKYPAGSWQDSKWTSIVGYAGDSVRFSFDFSPLDENDATMGTVELDSIIFAKINKQQATEEEKSAELKN